MAIFAPHVVQYHAPLYKELNKSYLVEPIVYFYDHQGSVLLLDTQFNQIIKWDIPLLEGYQYRFLKNYSPIPLKSNLFSRINFGVIRIIFNRPDIVLIHGYNIFSNWLVLIFCRLLTVPVIFKGEATLSAIEFANTYSIKKKLKKLIVKFFTDHSSAVLYSCTGNKEYFQHYGVSEKKLFPLSCAVDNDYFQNQKNILIKQKMIIKKEIGILEDEFVVCFLAQLSNRKRPMDLLKTIKELANKYIKLLIIGDGKIKKELEEYALKNNLNAEFVGFKNQSEISRYLIISDLYVIISEQDNSPKSLNEVMNFSLPVICTNVIGTAKDLVKDGVNGFLIEVGDIEKLKEKILFIKNNPIIAKEMGEKSLEIVSKFNFRENRISLEKVVEEII